MAAARVLIVEDEAIVAEDLAERLVALGYAVAGRAASAEAALALAAAERPDLALMDIRLQGVGDGIAAARTLRDRYRVPVIFLTAYADEASLARMKETGPLGCLLKPVEDSELRTAIEIALDRHRAEAALARYRLLAEGARDIVLFVDRTTGRILEANAAAVAAYGYPLEALLRLGIQDLRDPGTAALTAGQMAQADATGILFETEHRRQDGSSFPVEVSSRGADLDGRRVLLSVIRDITERTRHAAALQRLNAELEERVRQRTAEVEDLYNHAPCGYHSLDPEGRFVHINDTELAWLGYTREEVVGRLRLSDLLTDASRETFRRSFPLYKARGHVSDLEFDLVRKDGSTFPVLVSATMITDAAGSMVMSRSTVFDITARAKADQARREAEAALQRSRDELRAANEELRRAARLKDDFLANMSHELRTPLNAILGLAEALQEEVYGSLGEKQRSALSLLEESGRHLLGLINDILDLSKIEAGKAELELGPVGVEDLCQTSLQFVRDAAFKKGLEVTLQLDPAVPVLVADVRRLKQILVNLLMNAVKFTPEGGRLGLEVAGDRDRAAARFTVWDTGIGISEADAAKLFRSFVQLDSSLSRRHEGTGLGLALVSHLASLHGGSVELASAPGEGSRFTVWLPWAGASAEPVAAEPAAPPRAVSFDAADGPPSASPSPLLLLAEDNPTNVASVVGYLKAKGYRIVVAGDGLQALEIARRDRPALILMDVQMPVLDGLEAMRRLRANPDPGLAKTPILALTALAMRGDKERCLEAGATAYLAKPVRLKVLAETIARLLGPGHP